MKLSPKLLMALTFTFWGGICAHSQEMRGCEFQAVVGNHPALSSSIAFASPSATLRDHQRVTRYATRFAGDHSLDAATVTEQVSARNTVYAVRLQFASGAEQSIVVTAPPGGLLPEMSDMSGDSIPNDLVLTSGVFRVPLIVLINEGHDHLSVANPPGSFALGEDRASSPHQVNRTLALPRSGVKVGYVGNVAWRILSQSRGDFLPPIGHIFANSADNTSSAGRAPPRTVAQT